ncbi:MAG: PAS domain S-box protein [Treponema sp.]|jgi:PAS domain S-box-containing protein|nr:PAS domain S-box protein [Treponema sp.]
MNEYPDIGEASWNYRLFETFFRYSQEAMFITSVGGKFLEFNHSFETLLGYTREEIFTIGVIDTFHVSEDRAVYQKIIGEKGVVHQYPLVLKRKDGSPLPCLLDAIVWKQNGTISGYHGIIRSRSDVIESFKNFFNQLKTERQQLKEERKNLISDTMLLSRYMSDDVVEYVKRTGNNPLETAKRRVTILFFDIRRSTLLGESLTPDAFAGLLNDVLTDIMDLVYGCRGSVNKLIGDGLMATFGAPISTKNDALNAVQAAGEMYNYLKTFNDVRPDYLKEPLRAGIGLATGTVFAGVIGSVHRQEYTVLGDAVNIASRLQILTKSAPEKVLMDEETYREVKDDYPCRKVFSGKLRGREGSILIYGLNASREEIAPHAEAQTGSESVSK